MFSKPLTLTLLPLQAFAVASGYPVVRIGVLGPYGTSCSTQSITTLNTALTSADACWVFNEGQQFGALSKIRTLTADYRPTGVVTFKSSSSDEAGYLKYDMVDTLSNSVTVQSGRIDIDASGTSLATDNVSYSLAAGEEITSICYKFGGPNRTDGMSLNTDQGNVIFAGRSTGTTCHTLPGPFLGIDLQDCWIDASDAFSFQNILYQLDPCRSTKLEYKRDSGSVDISEEDVYLALGQTLSFDALDYFTDSVTRIYSAGAYNCLSSDVIEINQIIFDDDVPPEINDANCPGNVCTSTNFVGTTFSLSSSDYTHIGAAQPQRIRMKIQFKQTLPTWGDDPSAAQFQYTHIITESPEYILNVIVLPCDIGTLSADLKDQTPATVAASTTLAIDDSTEENYDLVFTSTTATAYSTFTGYSGTCPVAYEVQSFVIDRTDIDPVFTSVLTYNSESLKVTPTVADFKSIVQNLVADMDTVVRYSIQYYSVSLASGLPVVTSNTITKAYTFVFTDACRTSSITSQMNFTPVTIQVLQAVGTMNYLTYEDSVGYSNLADLGRCGPVQITFDKTQALAVCFLSTGSNAFVCKATDEAQVGTWTLSFKVTLTNYPFTSITESFQVVVDPCLEGVDTNPVLNYEYIIKRSELEIPVTHVTTPSSCAYPSTESYSWVDGNGISQPLPAFFTPSNDGLQVQSNDFGDDGEYFIEVSTCVDPPGSLTAICSTSKLFKVTVVNPCKNAFFYPLVVKDMEYWIGMDVVQQKLQLLQDSVSEAYGQVEFCGVQNWALTDWLPLTTADYTIFLGGAVVPESQPLVLTISVPSYPNLYQEIEFTGTVYDLIPPVIDIIDYTVGDPLLNVQLDGFKIKPFKENQAINVQLVQQLEAGFGQADNTMFTYQKSKNVLIILTNDTSKVGNHSLFLEGCVQVGSVKVCKKAQFLVVVHPKAGVKMNNDFSPIQETLVCGNDWNFEIEAQTGFVLVEVALEKASAFVKRSQFKFSAQGDETKDPSTWGQFTADIAWAPESLPTVATIHQELSLLVLCNGEKTTEETSVEVILNEPFIIRIYQNGVIDVGFKKETLVPQNLTLLETGTVEIDGELYPILGVEVAPSLESMLPLLNFTWSFISFHTKGFKIQLNFTHPEVINSNPEPDFLILHFFGVGFFIDSNGLPLKEDQHPKKQFVAQLSDQVFSAIGALGSSFQAGLIVTMVMAFAVNLVLSGALTSLMRALTYLSITVHLSLVNSQLPANVQTFLAYFVPIVLFDVIPTDTLYPKIFTLSEEDSPKDDQYEALGYFSKYLMNNLGSIFILLNLALPFLAVTNIVVICRKSRGKTFKLGEKFLEGFFWNGALGFVKENYFSILLCSLINLTTGFDFNGPIQAVSTAWSLLLTAVTLGFTLFFYLRYKWGTVYKREDYKFMDRYGVMIEDLCQSRIGDEWVIQQPAIQITRSLLIAVAVIFIPLQLFALSVIFAAQYLTMMSLGVNPYQDRSRNRLDLFNEFMVIIVCDVYMMFNDTLPDLEKRDFMGWMYVGLSLFMMGTNFGISITQSVQLILHRCKIAKLKRAQARKLKERQELKQSQLKASAERQVIEVQRRADSQVMLLRPVPSPRKETRKTPAKKSQQEELAVNKKNSQIEVVHVNQRKKHKKLQYIPRVLDFDSLFQNRPSNSTYDEFNRTSGITYKLHDGTGVVDLNASNFQLVAERQVQSALLLGGDEFQPVSPRKQLKVKTTAQRLGKPLSVISEIGIHSELTSISELPELQSKSASKTKVVDIKMLGTQKRSVRDREVQQLNKLISKYFKPDEIPDLLVIGEELDL